MAQTLIRSHIQRRADPWRDLDVIDARAPRTNQAVIGSLSLVAFATGWWPILALLAAQLALGLTLGRRWCAPCWIYFELIQPRLGEGPIEDSRPPRFANQLGFVFLSAASLAHLAGLALVGWALGLMVAALALLAAATGLCVGCEMYRIGARLRGITGHRLERVELADFGALADRTIVEFTHPLCTQCRELEERLRAEGHRVVTVDVSTRPDLAGKYGVAVVPVAVVVSADGTVISRLAG